MPLLVETTHGPRAANIGDVDSIRDIIHGHRSRPDSGGHGDDGVCGAVDDVNPAVLGPGGTPNHINLIGR